MNVLQYTRMASEKMFSSGLICRCCGARTYLLSEASESICSFCEAYVTDVDKQIIHGNLDMERNLSLMQLNLSQGKWEDAAQFADALIATKDPYLVYGAGSFYKYFSDHVYNGVDYTQGGFMYSNAAKRSDETLKNKHNAMALISKSKECFFRVIKTVADNTVQDNMLRYISFMSCMKLKRHSQARITMNIMSTVPCPEVIRDYMGMVYDVSMRERKAHHHITASMKHGVSNSIYYMSMYLAMHRHLDEAIEMLDSFAPRTNFMQASYFNSWLKNVNSASGF